MNTEPDVYPPEATDREQWVTWQYIDGRKQPNSLFGDAENTMRWSKPENWGAFGVAETTAKSIPRLEGVGFVLQKQGEPYSDDADDLVMIDFDDVRDPETGDTHERVRRLVERAGTYADVSTSGTGVHLIGRGELPEGVRTIQDDFAGDECFLDAEIEVYDGKRFVAMTGRHITATTEHATDIQAILEGLANQFDTASESTREYDDVDLPDNADYGDVKLTDDFEDVTTAIASVGPRDIRLRSTVTNERSNGTVDMDPSWSNSKSGTRLGTLEGGGWYYRDGGYRLDALQVVALEEGIITRESEYPRGEAFWRAVERLRERGANVPRYSGSEYDRSKAFKQEQSADEWFGAAKRLS